MTDLSDSTDYYLKKLSFNTWSRMTQNCLLSDKIWTTNCPVFDFISFTIVFDPQHTPFAIGTELIIFCDRYQNRLEME